MDAEKLVENVARAIGQKVEDPTEDMDSDWYGNPLWTNYRLEARADLTTALPMLRDEVERAHKSAQYDPAPYTKGKDAIRARFDEIAKDLSNVEAD